MAQPKASTLQQRFGFQDDDLKNPNHDEIMIWLDTYAEIIIKLILKYDGTWKNQNEEEIEKFSTIAKKLVSERLNNLQKDQNFYPSEDRGIVIENLKNWQLGEKPIKPELKIKKVWEHPILGKNNFIVGFIDMVIQVTDHFLYIDGIDEHGYGENKTYSLIDFGNKLLPKWKISWDTMSIFFEVKTVLPSLGELIRQIRMYQEFIQGKFYVVASDDKYVKQLNQQGIGFIKYPEGQIFDAV